jgi:protein TonB
MPIIKNPKADLRAHYRLHIKFSIIISIAIIIAAFKFSPEVKTNVKSAINIQELIKIDDVINTIQKTKPPKLPPKPRIIETVGNEIPDDFTLEDVNLDPDADVGPVNTHPDLHNMTDSDEKFYHLPEQMPEPIGGIKSIWEKVHYTEIAKRIGLTGTVYIEAAIDKKGNVVDAKIVRGIGGGLDEISLNAVKQTKFKPGMQGGRPVKVKMTIPIKFVLQ